MIGDQERQAAFERAWQDEQSAAQAEYEAELAAVRLEGNPYDGTDQDGWD